MWTIEPKRETIIKYSVVVTLDVDEINKILVDPADFQRQLRIMRNSFQPKHNNFASDGHAHGAPPNKKYSKKNRAGAAGQKLVKCPQCHKLFKSRGLMIHMHSHTEESGSKRAAVSADVE